jgi:branched-subunit amino acid ABC-type transport system permease component
LGGLTRGSIYALIAIGYTMVYGIIELINFAHGEVYMLGAFVGLIIAGVLGIMGFPAPAILVIAAMVAIIYCARIRLHHGEDRLQAPARGRPSLSAHFRHRHVPVSAELHHPGSDFRLSAFSAPDPGF